MKGISESHKSTKNPNYWHDLTSGVTSVYKERVLDSLLDKHLREPLGTVVDIGCGTCEMILRLKNRFKAKKAICLDYDEKIVAAMRERFRGVDVGWQVGDIFSIDRLDPETDLVLFIDMLHEVYSFYGRPDGNLMTPVNHTLGLQSVVQVLNNIGKQVRPGGGIAITDNVLCEENHQVKVRVKRGNLHEGIIFFFQNYPSRIFDYQFSGDLLEMNSRDFCILLTQYNKIKNNDIARWETERFEIHQYMTLNEFRDCFDDMGFDCHAVVGTPHPTLMEWEDDFEILEGLDYLPGKRITVLAIRR